MRAGARSPIRRDRPRRFAAGFTLIEMIIVIALIGILATMAIPNMRETPTRAKEAVLKADLHTFRDVIDQFFADRGHYPEDVRELVDKGYLRAVPEDPFTKSPSTWVPVYATDVGQEDSTGGKLGKRGIYDVKSGASGTGLDGRPYNEW